MRRLSQALALAGLSLALGVVGSAPSAVATTITNIPVTINVTTGGASNGGLTAWNFTATLPQFNNSLSGINADCSTGNTCVLTGVSVTMSALTTGNIVMTAGGSGSTVTGGQVGSQVTWNDPFVLVGSPPSPYQELLYSENSMCNPGQVSLTSSPAASCSGQTLTFAANQQITATLLSTASGNLTSSTSSGSILNQISNGTYEYITDGATQSALTGTFTNNVSQTQSISVTVSGLAAYTYTDTPPSLPEPASMAVFGVGLAGLGFVVRRRRG